VIINQLIKHVEFVDTTAQSLQFVDTLTGVQISGNLGCY